LFSLNYYVVEIANALLKRSLNLAMNIKYAGRCRQAVESQTTIAWVGASCKGISQWLKTNGCFSVIVVSTLSCSTVLDFSGGSVCEG
jgi:hypothetical protein